MIEIGRLATLVALAGCSNGATTPAPSVVGSWSGTDEGGNTIVMVFSADGTLMARGGDGTVSGSYTLDGDTILGTAPGYTFRGTVTGAR
jgi:hypothetical protein